MDGQQLPRAGRVQRSVNQADHDMTAIARANGRLVAWWWGIRKIDGVMSATCYVCGATIDQGAFNVTVGPSTLDLIDEHRAGHWRDVQAYRESQQ